MRSRTLIGLVAGALTILTIALVVSRSGSPAPVRGDLLNDPALVAQLAEQPPGKPRRPARCENGVIVCDSGFSVVCTAGSDPACRPLSPGGNPTHPTCLSNAPPPAESLVAAVCEQSDSSAGSSASSASTCTSTNPICSGTTPTCCGGEELGCRWSDGSVHHVGEVTSLGTVAMRCMRNGTTGVMGTVCTVSRIMNRGHGISVCIRPNIPSSTASTASTASRASAPSGFSRCLGTFECTAGQICTTERGDCLSCCPPGATVCIAACCGDCIAEGGTTSSASSRTIVANGLCGDGVVDAGEECDEGGGPDILDTLCPQGFQCLAGSQCPTGYETGQRCGAGTICCRAPIFFTSSSGTGGACAPGACGPHPGISDRICPDGSTAGARCERQANGNCGYVIRDCPVSSVAGCTTAECGPHPGIPDRLCSDGTWSGARCERSRDGNCSYVIHLCPAPVTASASSVQITCPTGTTRCDQILCAQALCIDTAIDQGNGCCSCGPRCSTCPQHALCGGQTSSSPPPPDSGGGSCPQGTIPCNEAICPQAVCNDTPIDIGNGCCNRCGASCTTCPQDRTCVGGSRSSTPPPQTTCPAGTLPCGEVICPQAVCFDTPIDIGNGCCSRCGASCTSCPQDNTCRNTTVGVAKATLAAQVGGACPQGTVCTGYNADGFCARLLIDCVPGDRLTVFGQCTQEGCGGVCAGCVSDTTPVSSRSAQGGGTCDTNQVCNRSTCQCVVPVTSQSSRSASAVTLCGNARIDANEQCGEPGLSCLQGQTCGGGQLLPGASYTFTLVFNATNALACNATATDQAVVSGRGNGSAITVQSNPVLTQVLCPTAEDRRGFFSLLGSLFGNGRTTDHDVESIDGCSLCGKGLFTACDQGKCPRDQCTFERGFLWNSCTSDDATLSRDSGLPPSLLTAQVAGSPACNNQLDDDGDGLMDFPHDTGCLSLTDTTETVAAGQSPTAIPASCSPSCGNAGERVICCPGYSPCGNPAEYTSQCIPEFADAGLRQVCRTSYITYDGEASCVRMNITPSTVPPEPLCDPQDPRVRCVGDALGLTVAPHIGPSGKGTSIVYWDTIVSAGALASAAADCGLEKLRPDNFTTAAIETLVRPLTSGYRYIATNDLCNSTTLDAYRTAGHRISLDRDCQGPGPYLHQKIHYFDNSGRRFDGIGDGGEEGHAAVICRAHLAAASSSAASSISSPSVECLNPTLVQTTQVIASNSTFVGPTPRNGFGLPAGKYRLRVVDGAISYWNSDAVDTSVGSIGGPGKAWTSLANVAYLRGSSLQSTHVGAVQNGQIVFYQNGALAEDAARNVPLYVQIDEQPGQQNLYVYLNDGVINDNRGAVRVQIHRCEGSVVSSAPPTSSVPRSSSTTSRSSSSLSVIVDPAGYCCTGNRCQLGFGCSMTQQQCAASCTPPASSSRSSAGSCLSVTKTGSPTVTRGGQTTYAVTVRNNCPYPIDDVLVRDILPQGMTYNAALSHPLCALQGNAATCRISTCQCTEGGSSSSISSDSSDLITDFFLRVGCGCFQGIRRCDIHAVNNGPDTAPSAIVEVALGEGVEYQGDIMGPVIGQRGHMKQMLGHGKVTRVGNTIIWDTNGIAMPPNSDFASWPKMSGPPGSTRTTTVRTPQSTDPNLANNTVTETFTNACQSKVVSPQGPICKADGLLYIHAVGHQTNRAGGVFTFRDELHPCLDPSTITLLEPESCKVEGRVITCENLRVTRDENVMMVSFMIWPRADCPIGTVIRNQATVTFTDGLSFQTNAVENRFCSCSDKSATCGLDLQVCGPGKGGTLLSEIELSATSPAHSGPTPRNAVLLSGGEYGMRYIRDAWSPVATDAQAPNGAWTVHTDITRRTAGATVDDALPTGAATFAQTASTAQSSAQGQTTSFALDPPNGAANAHLYLKDPSHTDNRGAVTLNLYRCSVLGASSSSSSSASSPSTCRNGAARMRLVFSELYNTDSTGNVQPRIFLGDGTTRAPEEWFDIMNATTSLIDPPRSIDVPGLSVSRKDREVEVSLYGHHPPRSQLPGTPPRQSHALEKAYGVIEFDGVKVVGFENDKIGPLESQGDGIYGANHNDEVFASVGATIVPFYMAVRPHHDTFRLLYEVLPQCTSSSASSRSSSSSTHTDASTPSSGSSRSSSASHWSSTPQCTDDDDCPADEVCRNGRCVDCTGSECSCDNTDGCPTGLVCIRRRCEECTSGNQCPSGICRNGRCECDSTNQCPVGQVCRDQRCNPCRDGECLCEEEDDCPSGQICTNGRCQSCTDNNQCLSGLCQNGACTCPASGICLNGQRCENGRCFPCSSDAECNGGQCVSGVCVSCRQHSDCETGLCQNGQCIACSSHDQCPSGLCVDGSCRACTSDLECAPGVCIGGVCTDRTDGNAGDYQVCGNGVLESPEECEDGGTAPGDGCSPDCRLDTDDPLRCGDGMITAGEECDDRNVREGDGCSAGCLLEAGICGDGIVQRLLNEQCEPTLHDSALPYGCDPEKCRFTHRSCGNGVVNPGEECDEGTRNSDLPDRTCRTDCSLPRCGDGTLDRAELCDDGNRVSGDGCDRYCKKELSAASPVGASIVDVPVLSVDVPGFLGFPLGTRDGSPLEGNVNTPGTGGRLSDEGPAAVAVMAGGAAAGFAWMRRRRKR